MVLLGPAHRVPVAGLAAPHATAFATPLGRVPLDRVSLRRVAALPEVEFFDAAHAREHSLEVHLPFLQHVLADFILVPLVVGDASPEQVARTNPPALRPLRSSLVNQRLVVRSWSAVLGPRKGNWLFPIRRRHPISSFPFVCLKH